MKNKILTELIGECYHDFSFYEEYESNKCIGRVCRCGAIEGPIKQNNFSTWEGFGKLWNFIQTQSWFDHFMWKCSPFIDTILALSGPSGKKWNINPVKFSDDVYNYVVKNKIIKISTNDSNNI